MQVYRQSGRMALVRTAMECLMLAGAVLGFVEALVLAEVLVGAEAGAAVGAEADLVIGNRCELAFS